MSHLKTIVYLGLAVGLVVVSPAGANMLDSCEALGEIGNVTTIDFEGIATGAGSANAVNLTSPYTGFPGVTLTKGTAPGLWVGEPVNDTSSNCLNFYGQDFWAVSGAGVFSPDNCYQAAVVSPVGSVIVDFSYPVIAVGLYFLDAEGAVSSIKAYDGAGGTGTELASATATGLPDNSQAFRYVASPGDIQSVVIQLGGGGDGVGMDDLCFVDSLTVGIDIKPGSDPNCFNINGHGVVPVAILGTAEFDVTTIDTATLMFNGLDVRIRGNKGPLCHYEDSNGDGFTDLVCQFEDDAGNWSDGSATACVEGALLPEFGAFMFMGCDSICVVP